MSYGKEETNAGDWTSDDIPEFLNAIRKEIDAEKESTDKINVVETEAEPLPALPPLDPWAKLQEVRLKNPVSGLTEYAQYLGQNCEFLLLNYSGPSHNPRFRMQVKLNGRLFPVAEASSKKNARKDAAAVALRRLVGDMQKAAKKDGKDLPGSGNQVKEPLPGASDTLEEACKAPASKKRRTAPHKFKPRPAPGMGQRRPPPYGSDYPGGNYREPGFGGSSNFPVCDMNQRLFPEDVNHYPGRNGKEGVGPLKGRPNTMFSDDFRRSHVENNPMDEPLERPGLMGTFADSSNLSDLLLTYLDAFQIENENDAQQVLKVTQKLTDMLLEYRLRSGSAASGPNETSVSSTSYSSQPSRLPSNSDRFSGQSSFSSGPSRFY